MSFFICCASQTLALHHILKCLHALCLHSNKLKEPKGPRTQDAAHRTRQTAFACIERRTHTNMLMLLFRASFKILLIFAYLFHFPLFLLCVLNVSQFPPFGFIVLAIHSTCSYHKKRRSKSTGQKKIRDEDAAMSIAELHSNLAKGCLLNIFQFYPCLICVFLAVHFPIISKHKWRIVDYDINNQAQPFE